MKPTRTRYWVLALAFTGAIITYLDRVCLSVAAPAISQELGLTKTQMGAVFSAFSAAYALFEIPAAWLGDLWGQRRTMTRILGAWSLFTMLTGLARNYTHLLATRFAFGAAEAGAFPTLSRMLSRWFPLHERTRANGFMWMGARLGGALSPALAVAIMNAFGWRPTFWIFGAVGILWCLIFWTWHRDDPAQHPAVNAAELAHITAGATSPPPTHAHRLPWRTLFLSPDILALFWAYFASGFGFLFFITWLPTYLVNEHGLTITRSGVYSAAPLAAGAIGCAVGGILSDWLARRTGSLKWGRRIIGAAGFLLGAAGFFAAMYARSAEAAIFWLAFSSLTHDLTVPVAWATCVDIGGHFGGTASGFMNLASSLSGMASPIAAAWLSEAFGTFHPLFAAAAAVYAIGGALWLYIDAERKPHAAH